MQNSANSFFEMKPLPSKSISEKTRKAAHTIYYDEILFPSSFDFYSKNFCKITPISVKLNSPFES